MKKIHFAFPNIDRSIVNSGEFIGCVRYTFFLKKEYVEDYQIANPGAKNLSNINAAVQEFAPEALNSLDTNVYEHKEQPSNCRGNSLHLAFFLAIINQRRHIKIDHVNNDIWCTGSIILENGYPYLGTLFDQEFNIKINAFLSDENAYNDNIFIINYGPVL